MDTAYPQIFLVALHAILPEPPQLKQGPGDRYCFIDYTTDLPNSGHRFKGRLQLEPQARALTCSLDVPAALPLFQLDRVIQFMAEHVAGNVALLSVAPEVVRITTSSLALHPEHLTAELLTRLLRQTLDAAALFTSQLKVERITRRVALDEALADEATLEAAVAEELLPTPLDSSAAASELSLGSLLSRLEGGPDSAPPKIPSPAVETTPEQVAQTLAWMASLKDRTHSDLEFLLPGAGAPAQADSVTDSEIAYPLAAEPDTALEDPLQLPEERSPLDHLLFG